MNRIGRNNWKHFSSVDNRTVLQIGSCCYCTLKNRELLYTLLGKQPKNVFFFLYILTGIANRSNQVDFAKSTFYFEISL